VEQAARIGGTVSGCRHSDREEYKPIASGTREVERPRVDNR